MSIGLPVFNGEPYLEGAIRSNLGQSFSDFELIICDNASTDATESICRDFANSDERVRYYRHERNVGAAANYNQAFRLSVGRFFRWSNADDLLEPKLIECTLPVLQARPDVVIAYGRTCLIDESGQSLGDFDDGLDLQQDRGSERYEAFYKRVRLTNVIYGLMRSGAMKHTPLMGNGRFPHADIHFMATMALQGKFVEVPQQLFYRRMHREALSSKPERQQDQTFWNASRAVFVLPHWRFAFAGLRAILSSSLSVPEKAHLLRFSVKRSIWQRRELARDFVRLFASASR